MFSSRGEQQTMDSIQADKSDLQSLRMRPFQLHSSDVNLFLSPHEERTKKRKPMSFHLVSMSGTTRHACRPADTGRHPCALYTQASPLRLTYERFFLASSSATDSDWIISAFSLSPCARRPNEPITSAFLLPCVSSSTTTTNGREPS